MRDILIVEDGALERERLRELLESHGYGVICAASAQQAEEQISLESFRLVLLDIGLGDKSGSHVFQQLSNLEPQPAIIIWTGNPSVHLKRRFMDQGAAGYIVKASSGSSQEALLNIVTDLLSTPAEDKTRGLSLDLILETYCDSQSRGFFTDSADELEPCSGCGFRSYEVVFNHILQLPPEIRGKGVCSGCGQPLDPKVE